MLSQIRHIQKGTLIVVTVIIVVSFAFLYSDFDFIRGTVGSQDCVVKVYDRCYRKKEAQKLASNFDVALQLGMYDFAMVLFGEKRQDRDPTDFTMSLVILRKEAEKLGIEPGETEIKEAIPQLPLFQQPGVTVDYVKNNILGPNGFTESDLANLVKDYLSFQKLRSLIGAGLEATPGEASKLYVKSNQRYSGSIIRFDRDVSPDAVAITDEEIKTYFEENKAGLNSEAKRGFDFIKFTPKPEVAGATNEEKAKATLAFANAVNRAYADLAEEGADFEAVAKQYVGAKADFTAEFAKLEPFSPAAPPEMMKKDEAALETIFSNALQPKAVTVPIQNEEGGYLVFYFNTLVEPVPLTLAEATPAIKEALTAIKSNRAVSDAASAALAKLNEAIKAGKSFDETAKALALKFEALPNFSEIEPPADLAEASLIVGAVNGLGEKQVSQVIERSGGQGNMLVYIDKIEIYKDAEVASKKKSLVASIENELDRTLFTSWLNQRRAEAGYERSIAPTDLQ